MPQRQTTPATPTPGAAKGPLDGITMIDLSQHLAGSYGTLILADLGARVVKVETPRPEGEQDDGCSFHRACSGDAHRLSLNRNKESMALDLGSEEGRALLLKAVAQADAVVDDLPAGTMQRLGLGGRALAEANPAVISLSLTSFGQDGPYARRPGGELVVQALSGAMSMTGEPDRPPVRAGIPIGDLAGGIWSAIAVLSALRGRDDGLNGGVGIDLSLLDGHVALIPYFSAYYFLDGFVPGPQGSGGHSPTYGAFRCADGRYVAIAVIDQVPWSKLCAALGRPDLCADQRFDSAEHRAINGEELRGLIQAELATRPLAEWQQRFVAGDLAHAAVNRLDEALADDQVLHRRMVADIDVRGDVRRVVGSPVTFPAFPPRLEPPPLVGQHTAAILGELGVGSDELHALHDAGVI